MTGKDDAPEWSVGMLANHRLGRFRITSVDRLGELQLGAVDESDPGRSFKDYAFYFTPIKGAT